MVAKQRSDYLRAAYAQDMQIFNGHPEMLIFIDETGKDRRNCMRRFGYSVRDKPPVSKKLLVRGQRVSAIAAMSTNGIIDCPTSIQLRKLFLSLNQHYKPMNNYWTLLIVNHLYCAHLQQLHKMTVDIG